MKKQEEVSNTQELQAIEIAKIKEPKKGNLLGLIAFFVIIMAFIFGLPYIGDYIDKIQGKTPTPINGNNSSNSGNEEEDNDTKPIHIDSANFIIDEWDFSNFELEKTTDNLITFLVTSTADSAQYINNSNIYLELYTSENTLLERLKVEYVIGISKNSPATLSLKVSQNIYDSVTNILVIKKATTDYPEVTLNKDGYGNPILVCANNNGTKLTYYFNEEKLSKIEDVRTFNRVNTVEEYTTLLNSKKMESGTYNSRLGFASSVTEITSGESFVMNTLIDLTKAELNQQDLAVHYNQDTLSKVVSFEMKARGYNCN